MLAALADYNDFAGMTCGAIIVAHIIVDSTEASSEVVGVGA